MRRITLLILFISLSSLTVYAQYSKADSLKLVRYIQYREEVDSLYRQSTNTLNVVEWNMVGNGSYDNSNAFDSILVRAKDLNVANIYIPDGTFLCSGTFDVDGTDSTKFLKFSGEGTLLFTDTTSAGSGASFVGTGVLTFSNFNTIILEGVTFQFRNYNIVPAGAGWSYLNGILLEENKYIWLDGITVKNAIRAGVQIYGVDYVWVTNCLFDSSTYGNLHISKSDGSYIVGNTFSNAGATNLSYLYGYGVSLGHRHGSHRDNLNSYIAGNQVLYNTRKGIDTHGSVGVIIESNYIKGWGVSATGGHNSPGQHPDSAFNNIRWQKRVTDLTIINNVIENDTAWANNLTTPSNDVRGISCGNLDSSPYTMTLFSAGYIKIQDNILRGMNAANQRGPVIVYVGMGDSLAVNRRDPHDGITVTGNQIYDVDIDTAYYTDGTININRYTVGYSHNKEVIIPFIDVSDNHIEGDAYIGIKVAWADSNNNAPDGNVMIKDNQEKGRFTYPVYCSKDTFATSNNLLNGRLLSNYTNRYTSTAVHHFRNTGAGDSLTLGMWDMTNYTDSRITYGIRLVVSNELNNHSAFYDAYAYVGSDDSVTVSGAGILTSTGIGRDPDVNSPQFVWRNVTEDIRTLKYIVSDWYSRSSIYMKLTSGNVPVWTEISGLSELDAPPGGGQ